MERGVHDHRIEAATRLGRDRGDRAGQRGAPSQRGLAPLEEADEPFRQGDRTVVVRSAPTGVRAGAVAAASGPAAGAGRQ